jgi:hypothetical protein
LATSFDGEGGLLVTRDTYALDHELLLVVPLWNFLAVY